MDVKFEYMRLDDVPGMRSKRPHDDWAVEAVDRFAKSGHEAAEVFVPEFDVSYTTVRNLLAKHGSSRGVKVRSVRSDDGRRTFLYRGDARC